MKVEAAMFWYKWVLMGNKESTNYFAWPNAICAFVYTALFVSAY